MSNYYDQFTQNGGYGYPQDGSYPQNGGFTQNGGYATGDINEAMLNPSYPPAGGVDSLALGGGHGDDQELDAGLFWQSGRSQGENGAIGRSAPASTIDVPMTPPAQEPPPLPAPQAVHSHGCTYPNYPVRHAGLPPPPPEERPTQPARYREPLQPTSLARQPQPSGRAEGIEQEEDISVNSDDEDGEDADIAALAASMNLGNEDDDSDDDGTFNVTGPSADGARKRITTTRREVRVGIRAMRHLKPHIQSYGKKGRTWRKTWKLVRRAGCFTEASQAVFTRRMEEVIKAHKDWDSAPAWLKVMGHDIIIDTGSQIENIKGEMERVRHDTEEQKEKKRKKHLEDEAGGDELRRESMLTRRRKRRATSDEGDPDGDQENQPPTKKRKRAQADAAITEDLGEIKEYAKEMAEASRDAAETYKEVLNSIVGLLWGTDGKQGGPYGA